MLNRDNQGGLMRRPQGTSMRPYGGSGLNRWDPFREMEEMHRRMDDLFSQVFGIGVPDVTMPRGLTTGVGADTEPDVDIYENDNEYIIHAFLPGVDQNDIQVHATENSISLLAETRSPFEEDGSSGDQGGMGTSQGAGQSAQGRTPSSQGSSQTTGQASTQTTGQTTTQAAGTGGMASGGAQGSTSSQPPHTQHRQSRYSRYNRFQFAYTLPEEIEPNQVRANFRNGRLELNLPKRQKAQQGGAVRILISGQQQNQPSLGAGASSSSASKGGDMGAGAAGTPAMTGAQQGQQSMEGSHQPGRGGENSSSTTPSTSSASTTGASTTGASKSGAQTGKKS